MIDFSTLKGLSIPEGVVTQIADASGRVLWSATIKFTINGDTYIADRGMTWAAWFASDYNTTGETEGTITDSNGNEVSMDAVIVGGTAYEVGFGSSVIVNVIRPSGSTGSVTIDGIEYTVSGTYEALESISVLVKSYISGPPSYYSAGVYVYLNNTIVATADYGATANYSLSLDGCSEVTIEYKNTRNGSVYDCYITTT